MSWSKLPPHPGFVLIDDDGAHRAYINTRPGPAVIAAWKERYPEHSQCIDEGLAQCFPSNEEEKDGSSSNG